MKPWIKIRFCFRSLLQRPKPDSDLESELRAHIDLQTQENIANGMSPKEARHAAHLQLGHIESIKNTYRDQQQHSSLIIHHSSLLLQDLRYALRQLRKNPAFTAIAILTLALGIGANTAMFSVIDAVILKPLPFQKPDSLITIWESNPLKGIPAQKSSPLTISDWRAQNHSFETLASWTDVSSYNFVLPDGGTEKVNITYADSDLFTALKVTPQLGRLLLSQEDQPKGSRAALISYEWWQSHFGGNPDALGQSISLDTYGKREYAIVGIMPPDFHFPSKCDLWLSSGWNGLPLDGRRGHWLNVIGRLKPGVTVSQARAELTLIQARLANQYRDQFLGSEIALIPLLKQTLGPLHRGMLVLWAVVAGILLIACANIANLLLARATLRQKEIALRAALGATRSRVIRQLLTESLLLSTLGAAIGILLAVWGLKLFSVFGAGAIPRLETVTLDLTALAFTFALSLVTGLLFGLAPAWQFSSPDLNDALKTSGQGLSSGLRGKSLRNFLVISEVGISLVLLVCAGLMLHSFLRLITMDRGYQTSHLLTVDLDFSISGYTTWAEIAESRPQVTLRELMDRLSHKPGVISVGAANQLPTHSYVSFSQSILIEGRLDEPELPQCEFAAVTPHYFETLGSPLLRGRHFNEADQYNSPQVAIINETMARRYFPNQDPIGKRLTFPDRDNPRQPIAPNRGTDSSWREIVGIVADVKNLSLRPEPLPQTYVPYWQWPMQNPTLLLRTSGDPHAATALLLRETKAVNSRLPVPRVQTMDEIITDTVAQPRFQAGLLTLFGLVALALTTIGIYGVLTCAVARRTQEIGIRIALGAQKLNVFSLVIKQGMKLVLIGLALGLLASLALTRILASLLYEIKATDPLTFLGVTLLLAAVGLLACWLPARRAMRINPMIALRNE